MLEGFILDLSEVFITSQVRELFYSLKIFFPNEGFSYFERM